jgi:hypothetical protein
MVASTIDFGVGNSERYFTIPGFDLPNADYCIGWCERFPNPGTSTRKGVIAQGGIGDASSLLITSAMYGGVGDRSLELGLFSWDETGTSVIQTFGPYLGGDRTESDFFCFIQRRTNTAIGYAIPIGAGVTYTEPTLTGDYPAGAVTGVGSDMFIGCRADLSFFIEDPFGEFFVLLGESLTASELMALAAGASILSIGKTPARYYKFRADNATEPDLGSDGADATQHGTGWTTTTEFFADTASTTPITNDADFRWNVLQAVQQDADLRWSVLANIIKDSDLRWSILKLINKDVDLRWSVLQMIYRDLELRWDSDGSNSTVFSDATLQWSIIATIAQSLTLDWNVLQTITHDADIRWAILSAVAKDFEARWDVRQALQADATIEWNIIGTAAKTITLRWNIQSETSFEDISGVITVNSATGKITALTKTPVITTL